MTNENIKISNHTLDQLLYRFSVHQSNLKHRIEKVDLKIFSTSVVRFHSDPVLLWHQEWLENLIEIGRIFFLGLQHLNEKSAFPRLLIPPEILKAQFENKDQDYSHFWSNSNDPTLFNPDYEDEDSL